MKRFCPLLLTACLLGISKAGFCQEDFFVALSSVKARPLAMGGAFTSIRDDLSAMDYNPAAFDLYQSEKIFRLTVFFNPVAPVVVAKDHRRLSVSSRSNWTDAFISLGSLVKAVTFSMNSFTAGFLFAEQSLGTTLTRKDRRVLSADGFLDHHSNSAVVNLRLAERVSIALATSLYYQTEGQKRQWGLGSSYGVLLKTARKVRVGVAYIDLPKKMPDYRATGERILDETVNFGVSYEPDTRTLLSADIRNLTEEERRITREVHLGAERVLFSQVALRVGYYRKKIDRKNVFSCGLGLMDGNHWVEQGNQFGHPNFCFNYAFVYDSGPDGPQRWHFASLIIRM